MTPTHRVAATEEPSSNASAAQDSAPSESASANTVESQENVPTCPIARAHEFDFWIGKWQVERADGSIAGYNWIHPILDGCVIQEDYETANGQYIGRSLNRFDGAGDRWHQAWVDNGGLWLELEGGLVEGAMVLRGETVARRDRNGQVIEPERVQLQEIRWEQLPDGRVRQTWSSSSDDGASWTQLFDGYYRRIESFPPEVGVQRRG